MKKCNNKFQLCDLGIINCKLDENHIGSHKFSFDSSSYYHRDVDITWSRDEYKDIDIDLLWLKENSNLIESLNKILHKYDFLEEYVFDDESFNDDLYGERFTLNIEFHLNKEIKLKVNNDFDKFLEFQHNNFDSEQIENLISNDFYNMLNLNVKLYNLTISIDVSFDLEE